MEDRLLSYLDAAESALAQYGPQTGDLVLLLARLSAAEVLVIGVVCTLAAFLVFFPIKEYAIELLCAPADTWEREGIIVFSTFVFGILSSALVIISVAALLNIYAWIGLFRPEVWIAHKALQAAL